MTTGSFAHAPINREIWGACTAGDLHFAFTVIFLKNEGSRRPGEQKLASRFEKNDERERRREGKGRDDN